MSSAARNDQREAAGPPAEVGGRLGYLLKHAQQRMAECTAAALEPHGINGRELAVLLVLDGQEPASQQHAADRLGVDRTTMVALIDALEDKGIVVRRPDPSDRRRNVVALTPDGQTTLRQATKASEEAERRFLEPLGDAAGKRFRSALQVLITPGR